MGKNKKTPPKPQANKTSNNVSTISLEEIKAEVAVIAEQYEILAAQFKETTNKLGLKMKLRKKNSSSALSARVNSKNMDLAIQDINQQHLEVQALVQRGAVDIRSVEQQYAQPSTSPLIVGIVSLVDLSGSVAFKLLHQQISDVVSQLETIKNKLGTEYLNAFTLVYIKFLILKSKCFHSESNPSQELRYTKKACDELNSALELGRIKYTHDIVFQHEVSWSLETADHILETFQQKNDSESLELVTLDVCLFADKCVSEALKLTLYSLALFRLNNEGRFVLHYPNGIDVAGLHHHYDVTRRNFFNLLERKKVDAQAIIDFIKASFIIFTIKNLGAKNSFFYKNRHEPCFGMMSESFSDVDVKIHIEMTKKQRLDYLGAALRLLSLTNLSVVFSDMAIYAALRKMLVDYRADLYQYVIVFYEHILKKRNKDDDLSADIKLEIIQFKRLGNMMIDCFQFLEELNTNATHIIFDQQSYADLAVKENEILVFRELEFLHQEKIAKDNADALLKWDEDQKKYEERRLSVLEKRKIKKKPFYKDKKATVDNHSSSSAVTGVLSQVIADPAISASQIDAFMVKAVTYIQAYQYEHACKAYEVAKKMAMKAGDTYRLLCALDGLIYASGAKLLRHLDYVNAIISLRLERGKVWTSDERQSLFDLLESSVNAFKKIKIIYEEYGEVVNCDAINNDLDIKDGVDFGKQLIQELLELTENKVLQAQDGYAKLNRSSKQSYEYYKLKKGLEIWYQMGNKGTYDEKEVKQLAENKFKEAFRNRVAIFKQTHGNKPYVPEDVYSQMTIERKMLKQMAPLMCDLSAIPANMLPLDACIVDARDMIPFASNFLSVFVESGMATDKVLLAGETVVNLLRKSFVADVKLPQAAVLQIKDTTINSAKAHAKQQFFTKTSVCCNNKSQLIDVCRTGVDDILHFHLRMIAPDPLKQINETPECLIEAIKHMREGDIPVANLETAMREWQPGKDYESQYPRVLAAIRQQFVGLTADERVAQIKLLIDYGLLKKLFNIDLTEPRKALWMLEDKWMNLSPSRFYLLAKSVIRQRSYDDNALTPVVISKSI